MSEWIKCSERLPSEDGYYLILCNGQRCLAERGGDSWETLQFIDPNVGKLDVFSSYEFLKAWTQKNTSHWMFLPAPPKETP